MATKAVVRIGAAREHEPLWFLDASMQPELEGSSAMQEELEASLARAKFLLDASALLTSSLDHEHTLSALAQLCVARIADCCAVVSACDGEARTLLSLTCADASQQGATERAFREIEANAPFGLDQALQTAEPRLHTDLRAVLADDGDGARHECALLGLRSAVIVPMVAHAKVLGAIVLVRTERSPRYLTRDLAMAEDLAHRAAMAMDASRTHARAQEGVRLRDDLLSIVSHDLRNPLSGVVLRCAALLEDLPLESPARRHVDAIKRQTATMSSMLRDLIDFTASRAGGLRIEPRSESVDELVYEARDAVASLAGSRVVDVLIDSRVAQRRVSCDRERVLQIFSNLIGNAIKFTSPTGMISLEATEHEGGLCFAVRDDGAGMSRQEQASIFQKYWQKRRKPGSGIGLGLYIVHTLVEAHGGKIWVESAPAAGSTFFFTLPAAKDDAEISTRKRRVLVVDDDTAVRREVREVLEGAGYEVAEAQDGRAALVHLHDGPRPNIVLLDLMMPTLDGWELAATMRGDPALASIPLVVMSCLDAKQAAPALAAAQGFLRKPPQLDELLKTVQRLVSRSLPRPGSSPGM